VSAKILSFDDIASRSIGIRVDQEDQHPTPINDVLDDEEKARAVLQALGFQTATDALERFVSPYSEDDEALDPMRGVQGLAVRAFVNAFQQKFEIGDGTENLKVKVGGKVCDYIFIPDLNNPEKGEGHLSVDVLHEYFKNDESLVSCKPDKTEFYHWDIEICEYKVHKRFDLLEGDNGDPSHFPKNPFPTLQGVIFPAHALDENDPRSIWCRCLDHKLYAKGKDAIKVQKVYRQIEDKITGESEDFKLLNKNDPEYREFYQSTKDSCVDIMFKGYPPLVGLPKQREYCLGRCEYPDIVNTGM
jgi:hypothetical protein